MVRPCLCRGTQSWIHEACLAEVRRQSSTWFNRCTVCHYAYRDQRMWLANVAKRPCTATTLTVLVIVASVAAVVVFLRTALALLAGIKLLRPVLASTRRLVWWAVLLIGFVTMLVTLFGEDGPRPQIEWNDHNRLLWHPDEFATAFNVLGYSFSLVGFCLYIKKVYAAVDRVLAGQLVSLSQRIVEVQD